METLRHKCKIVLSIFVSLFLMVVSISASLAEGEVKTLTATLIEDQITLNVNATVNGELPEDATLKVTKITNKDEHYADYEKALKAQADQDHYLNNAYSIYDYAFMSHDQEIALPAEATITMTYSKPYAPANATNEDEVSLYRLSSQMKDLTKETDTKLVMSDNTNKVTSLTYKTDTLDPIALTYREKKQSLGNVKVHYVDEKDPTKSLAPTQTLSASSLNGALNFDALSKALADTDKTSYTYKRTLFNKSEIAGAKVEKKNDLSYFYYVAKDSQDYTPYKGEGETFDIDLYFVYEVKEKQDTADQLVDKEKDTADELIDKTESKDTSDELAKKQETSTKEEKDTANELTKKTETKETEKSSSQSSKKEEKDTADELTAASDTKDTADQLTSSSKDTADQTTTKDTADQVKGNTSNKSTSTKKAVLKRAVLRAAPAANANVTVKIDDNTFDKDGLWKLQAKVDGLPDNAKITKYEWYRNDTKVEREIYAGNYNIAYNPSEANWLDVSADEKGAQWGLSSTISYTVKITYSIDGQLEKSVSSESWKLKYYGKLENGGFENVDISQDPYNYGGYYGYMANYQSIDKDDPDYSYNNIYESNNRYNSRFVWKTTSDYRHSADTNKYKGCDMEVVNARNQYSLIKGWYWWPAKYNKYWQLVKDKGAENSDQFAELNAESSGALYQDVLTHPDIPMYYELAHRARRIYKVDQTTLNSMYLVIAPTKEVQGITQKGTNQQANLIEFINNSLSKAGSSEKYEGDTVQNEKVNKGKILLNKNGILIMKVVSDSDSWNEISSQIANAYIPTSNLTRFFFVAGATANDDKTVGNFLDNVRFSQDPPNPEANRINLSFSKNFKNLTASQVAKFAVNKTNNPFTITVKNSKTGDNTESFKEFDNLPLQFKAEDDGELIKFTPIYGNDKNVLGSSSTYAKTDKNIRLSWIFSNHEIDNYEYQFTAKETHYNLEDYKADKYNSVNGKVKSDDQTDTFKVDKDEHKTNTVEFVNTYTVNKTGKIVLTKNVAGNQGDRTKYFKFKVLIKNVAKGKEYKVNVPSEGNHQFNPNQAVGNASGEIALDVWLKDGQSLSIEGLPINDEKAVTYQLSEYENESKGYQREYSVDESAAGTGNSTDELTLANDNSHNKVITHNIAFTNTKNGEIPTGTQKNAVFTLPLLIAGIGFALTILKKKNDAE
ncbi:MAG: hypothetical protein ACI32Q_09895 [Intestinibaculum porci]|uniref:DUF7601 domain-containing protein n=1 Tax=Intestinibaculum porci TaxID=2487118 RepID=UPI003F03849E